MSCYSERELKTLGLLKYGRNVQISKKASIYNPGRISIGSNVRIDDFSVLSAGAGGIEIGDYIHIAVFCALIGGGKISLADFCNLSSRVAIYSSNDDYSGNYLTNPTVPEKYTNVEHEDVMIGKHVIVGSGSVVLPGVVLDEGVAIGALSLVKKSCDEYGIYAGVPAQKIGERQRRLAMLEEQLLQENP